MTPAPSRDLIERLQRLRTMFVDEGRGERALADYWRSDADLAAYDAVLGARIGWKWDAALAECADRGFQRADADVVLDHGCGSGIAARRFAARFGVREVLCHDRSAKAMAFAARSLHAAGVAARAVRDVAALSPDVLLVSHVLGELDSDGERALRDLIGRSRRVVIVEPGSKAVARRLAAVRDAMVDTFRVIAPCVHAGRCPTLGNDRDWCHFFAAPAPEAFTDGDWVRVQRELGLDARALPYSFLALARDAAGAAPPAPPHRVLGRPDHGAHATKVQVCDDNGLRTAEVHKRTHAALWRALKKDPESIRSLPR